MFKFRLFGIAVIFLGFSSSALASKCPDMNGSYRSPQQGDTPGVIEKQELWIIPFKGKIHSINSWTTLDNIISGYSTRNIPNVTCSALNNGTGVESCVSSEGVYFKQNDSKNTAEYSIPSKNGDLVRIRASVDVRRDGMVSCRKKYSIHYELRTVRDAQTNYARDNDTLPYLLFIKRMEPITVREYNAAPQF